MDTQKTASTASGSPPISTHMVAHLSIHIAAGYGRLEHRHRQTIARVELVALVSDAKDFVCHDPT